MRGRGNPAVGLTTLGLMGNSADFRAAMRKKGALVSWGADR